MLTAMWSLILTAHFLLVTMLKLSSTPEIARHSTDSSRERQIWAVCHQVTMLTSSEMRSCQSLHLAWLRSSFLTAAQPLPMSLPSALPSCPSPWDTERTTTPASASWASREPPMVNQWPLSQPVTVLAIAKGLPVMKWFIGYIAFIENMHLLTSSH